MNLIDKPQSYDSIIYSIDYSPNKQVLLLRLKLSHSQFCFKEGQFVMIHLVSNNVTLKRSYSIATSYMEYLEQKTIGFIIKSVPDWVMSKHLFGWVKIWDSATIIWPLGHLTLPESTKNKNFILISTWSWLSPIYGIFEKLSRLDEYSSIIHLYWEKSTDRLIPETLPQLTIQNRSIFNKICLSREPNMALENQYNWYVWQCLTDVWHNWLIQKDSLCYLCGKPTIVEQLIFQLREYGITKENIKHEQY